jgi:hypothetical protein
VPTTRFPGFKEAHEELMKDVQCTWEVEERGGGGGGRAGKMCYQDLDYRWINGELTYFNGVCCVRACVRYR